MYYKSNGKKPEIERILSDKAAAMCKFIVHLPILRVQTTFECYSCSFAVQCRVTPIQDFAEHC